MTIKEAKQLTGVGFSKSLRDEVGFGDAAPWEHIPTAHAWEP